MGMATHSGYSCLENLRIEEPGGHSAVGHDQSNFACKGMHLRIRAEMQFLPPHIHHPSLISLKKLKDRCVPLFWLKI